MYRSSLPIARAASSALFVVLLVLGLGACSSTDRPGSDSSAPCGIDTDCPTGYHCDADGICAQDCGVDEGATRCGVGSICTDRGRCMAQGECTVDADCDAAPASSCQDASTLLEMVGECKLDASGVGECDYVPVTEPCAFGCEYGACLEDTCADVACTTPPEPACDEDGQTLLRFDGSGECHPDRGCQYDLSPQTCAHGCEAGQCNAGVCEAESCQTPPGDRCDANTAIRYAAQGECQAEEGQATCVHAQERENCSYRRATCAEGVCVGGVEQSGAVVITEYMASPSGIWAGIGEWFEIVNTSGAPLDLNGWKIVSGPFREGEDDEEHVISGAPLFPAGARLLFANSNDPGQDGSLTPNYVYSRFDIILNGYSDFIALVSPEGDVADLVYWEPGSIMDGRSRKLDPTVGLDALGNDDPRHWCPSLDEADAYGFGGQNYGRPGMENTPCTAQPCQDVTCVKPDDYCSGTGSAVQYQRDTASCVVTRFNNPWCNFEPETVPCSATELCFDGACEALPANLPEPGELVITELMGNPTLPDNQAEWIEIYNRSDRELSLFTLSINDNEVGRSFDTYQIVDRDAVVAAGEYILFVRSTDPDLNGGIGSGFYYSGNHLKDQPSEGMQISLVRTDGEVISAVHYGTPRRGYSQQLSVDVYKDVDALNPASLVDPTFWCSGQALYGSGSEYGTPGADNLICPL